MIFLMIHVLLSLLIAQWSFLLVYKWSDNAFIALGGSIVLSILYHTSIYWANREAIKEANRGRRK